MDAIWPPSVATVSLVMKPASEIVSPYILRQVIQGFSDTLLCSGF